MKRLLIFILFFTSCFVSKSQNLFETGLNHFNKGEYFAADSLFSLYLKEAPNDINAHFNHGATRLYLRDTCGFCEEMLIMRYTFRDNTANDLYFKVCSSLDTLFYDKQNVSCKKEKARFIEIIENRKCSEYKLVTVHDKRNKGNTILINPSDIVSLDKSDIVAVYRLYSNSLKVFEFCSIQPTFSGGDEVLTEFRNKSPLVLQTKNMFNLSHVVAHVEYVVDRYGDIRDINLINVDSKIDQMEDFKKHISMIISSMPKHIPATYRDENVDYLVRDFLSFW